MNKTISTPTNAQFFLFSKYTQIVNFEKANKSLKYARSKNNFIIKSNGQWKLEYTINRIVNPQIIHVQS